MSTWPCVTSPSCDGCDRLPAAGPPPKWVLTSHDPPALQDHPGRWVHSPLVWVPIRQDRCAGQRGTTPAPVGPGRDRGCYRQGWVGCGWGDPRPRPRRAEEERSRRGEGTPGVSPHLEGSRRAVVARALGCRRSVRRRRPPVMHRIESGMTPNPTATSRAVSFTRRSEPRRASARSVTRHSPRRRDLFRVLRSNTDAGKTFGHLRVANS